MNWITRAFTLAVVFALAATLAHAQAWRGLGRLSGTVVDMDGKPVEGAQVTLRSQRAGDTGPDPVKTDKRGKWAFLGLIGGTWHIDVEKEGYLLQKGSAEVSEAGRVPPIQIQLEEVPPPAEPEPAREEIQVGGQTISEETAMAIDTGNRLMGEQKYKEAIVEYEKAQTELPTNIQLKQALARAYYGAGQVQPAVALLRDVHAADPTDSQTAMLLGNLLLEDGKLEEAKKIIDGLPADAMSEPTAYINVGILFLNKGKPDQAKSYFDKAVSMDESRGASYYYRGLAHVQMQKLADARADLEKTIALAPDSEEAAEAKELLKAIK